MIKTILGWMICGAAWFAFGFYIAVTVMTA